MFTIGRTFGEVEPVELRYNQLRQKTTHTSFCQPIGLFEQYLYWRIRSFEFTVHTRDIGEPVTGDWKIYQSEYGAEYSPALRLTDVIKFCQRINDLDPTHELVTIFLDEVDFDSTGHTPAVFDTILRQLPERMIVKPIDITVSTQRTLQQAIKDDGWPRITDLRGKFLFVLTNEEIGPLAFYNNRTNSEKTAFIAPKLYDAPAIYADPNTIFFNLDDTHLFLAREVEHAGFVSKGYLINNPNRWSAASTFGVNFLTTDVIDTTVLQWASTNTPEGFPFESKGLPIPPKILETEKLLSMSTKSGDLYGMIDNCFYRYATVRNIPQEMVFHSYFIRQKKGGNFWAKGGLMLRESVDSYSPYLAVLLTGDGPQTMLTIQFRTVYGQNAEERFLTTIHDRSYAKDALRCVRLEILHGGKRIQVSTLQDTFEWQVAETFNFNVPLTLQGYAVSAHGGERVSYIFGGATTQIIEIVNEALLGDAKQGIATDRVIFPPYIPTEVPLYADQEVFINYQNRLLMKKA